MKKKGAYKIEFAANLPYIKEKIANGIVVISILHEELFKEKKITMQYRMFNYYCNYYSLLDDFKPVKKIVTVATINEPDNQMPETKKQNEPIELNKKYTSKDVTAAFMRPLTDEEKRRLTGD